mgnify:CR=1 FL=1
MTTMNASDFKARCLSVLDEVARTGEQVTILKRGKPVARLVPAAGAGASWPQERLKGSVEILGDVISPAVDPGEWEAERR